MSGKTTITKAFFTPKSGKMKGKKIKVHFNPASLQYTISNTMKNKGKGNKKKQYVTQSTAKLTMDLIFDTTDTGEDVRTFTEKIACFMEPEKKIPAVVQFEWGTYQFKGMVESYKETIDFFAPSGVPLRASINLTLSRQDKVFEATKKSKFDTQRDLDIPPVQLPTSDNNNSSSIAQQGGDSGMARQIAAANNQESLRFASGDSLVIEGSVELGTPEAFASGGFGAGVDAEAAASLEGFPDLRIPTESGTLGTTFDPENLLPSFDVADVSTDAGASFGIGGQASIEGSTSLSANVGASVNLHSRIQFEED